MDALFLSLCGGLAYIGPGAGFAFLGSFLAMAAAVALAVLSLLSLPARLLVAALRAGARPRGSARRVVVVGLDGLDPRRARALMGAGRLPNLAELARRGTFAELQTTCPPISPVAWSTFMTGANPGKHGIFDFLNRDLRTYLPELSSCRIREGRGRRRAEAAALRRSVPFWKVLGEHGVFSTVLRVPVTFPPEPFNGLLLSAMCAPDLRGTQGTFTVVEAEGAGGAGGPEGSDRYDRSDRSVRSVGSVRSAPRDDAHEPLNGGRRVRVALDAGGRGHAALAGPVVGGRELSVALDIGTDTADGGVTLRTCGSRLVIRPGEYSPWVRLVFRSGWRRISGICRFLLVRPPPALRLYVTPINIDPERPAMPVSHPRVFSAYLAKLLGPFATLGLAEDTWALTEGVISREQFLRQAYDIHEERERMFLESLKRTRRGLCLCVFDLADRVQHMFEGGEAGSVEQRTGSGAPPPPAARTATEQGADDAVGRAYARADETVGRALRRMGPEDVLLVVSDHGFGRFTRGVNLNAWLREHGYLAEKPGAAGRPYLADVDWSRTRAYSFGLAGLYLNVRGREAQGIVEQGEAAGLRQEICAGLTALRDAGARGKEGRLGDGEPPHPFPLPQGERGSGDDAADSAEPPSGARPCPPAPAPTTPDPCPQAEDGARVVVRAYDATRTYAGPYSGEGPDVVVGFADGYRAGWDAAVGRTDGPVFADNGKAWGGDHCLDRSLVPGVFFCSRPARGEAQPHIMDMAPTILKLFGVDPPAHMDGKAMEVAPAGREAV